MGRAGARTTSAANVESVLRTLHRPILLTPERFKAPESVMLAFDGSATSRRSVELFAASPLPRGLPVHILTVGADDGDHREPLEWARQRLASAGYEVHATILAGDVEPTLHAYQAAHGIDVLVMGQRLGVVAGVGIEARGQPRRHWRRG